MGPAQQAKMQDRNETMPRTSTPWLILQSIVIKQQLQHASNMMQLKSNASSEKSTHAIVAKMNLQRLTCQMRCLQQRFG
jgi:hypothetical protein